MSEKINIENSTYEFDIFLVSEAGDKAIPINKSSVRYLEIEDNLANIGLKGKVVISNYYGLLQKLNIHNVSSGSPNIFIRFKNLDLDNLKSQVYVLGCMGKSFEMSSNIVDRHIALEFEEYNIVKLKRQKINDPAAITSYASQSPAKGIKAIFEKFCKRVVLKDENIKESSVISIPSTIIKAGDSAYDVVKKCYDHLAYGPGHKDFLAPGLVQLENDESGETGNNGLQRKLVVKSLAEDMKKFFEIVQSNGKSASQYLIDKFTVVFSSQSKVLKDNFITKYDIMRVDYEDVFENKWSNISKQSGTEDVNRTDFYSYMDLREAFEQMFTNPYSSNLPSRDPNNIRILTYHYPGSQDGKTTTAWATNKTFKSFVYDNVAIVFKVKGQPYRISGRFIRINTDDPDGANKSETSYSSKSCASFSKDDSEEADSLNGWWYIISVQHIFENDIYFNRITAVKIYSPVELPPVQYGIIADDGGVTGATGVSGTTEAGDIIPEQSLGDQIDVYEAAQQSSENTLSDPGKFYGILNNDEPVTRSATPIYRSATPISNGTSDRSTSPGTRFRNQQEIDAATPLPTGPGGFDVDAPSLLPPLEN